MITPDNGPQLAVWAITHRGAELGGRLVRALPGAVLHLSERMEIQGGLQFKRLAPAVEKQFNRFKGHVFIMSTGIVVRMVAPLLRHKTQDPAVVVADERGRHAISLLSGHLGGANDLARQVAGILGGDPVITTATDVNDLPAIDILAQKAGLSIENADAIKHVNAAILEGKPVFLHDPFDFSGQRFGDDGRIQWRPWTDAPEDDTGTAAGVLIDDTIVRIPKGTLLLRPPTLIAGMGCNRGTDMAEMLGLLTETLDDHGLNILSLAALASVDIKQDEDGLLSLAEKLGVPLNFYSRNELKQVENIENPSKMVEKHIGVKSVCEAAAILATRGGRLIVPKKNTKNVTVAIARVTSLS